LATKAFFRKCQIRICRESNDRRLKDDPALEPFRAIARDPNGPNQLTWENEGPVTFEARDALIRAVAEEQATAMSTIKRPTDKKPDAGFGQPFRKLPLRLRQRWWQQTNYGERPASDELMWAIEACNEEVAMYLAARDRDRHSI
jgi:hypothetical protein